MPLYLVFWEPNHPSTWAIKMLNPDPMLQHDVSCYVTDTIISIEQNVPQVVRTTDIHPGSRKGLLSCEGPIKGGGSGPHFFPLGRHGWTQWVFHNLLDDNLIVRKLPAVIPQWMFQTIRSRHESPWWYSSVAARRLACGLARPWRCRLSRLLSISPQGWMSRGVESWSTPPCMNAVSQLHFWVTGHFNLVEGLGCVTCDDLCPHKLKWAPRRCACSA